jgi:hypothetical protein
MFKKYRLGFDVWGMLLFLIVMIPNFIWFAIPAPNDVLRVTSVTEVLDTIASVCQVLMIIVLCVLVNRERKKISITPMIVAVLFCCFLYFVSWVIYYSGIVNVFVILGLTIPPCLTFLFFSIDRKNVIAIVPITIFTVCHLIYGIVNFII